MLLLAAWTNRASSIAIATCVAPAPGPAVAKKIRSPAVMAAGSTGVPTAAWSRAARGSATPAASYTYRTNPLQSNPEGSLPPSR